MGMADEKWEVPDSIEPLVGYRAFACHGGNILKSVYREYEWIPGENQALCIPHTPTIWMGGRIPGNVPPKDHSPGVVDEKCHCGFWALDSLDRFNSIMGGPVNPSSIWGRVLGYGRVAIGTQGWRAEKAKIIALYLRPSQHLIFKMHDDPSRLERVADQYNVPVVPIDFGGADLLW